MLLYKTKKTKWATNSEIGSRIGALASLYSDILSLFLYSLAAIFLSISFLTITKPTMLFKNEKGQEEDEQNLVFYF